MTAAPALLGAVRYEFLMQIRRRGLWLVMGAATAVIATFFAINPGGPPAGTGPWSDAASLLSGTMAYFLPLAFGVMMSDRVPRERRLHTTEVLESLPTRPAVRLWGKLLGAGAATAVPLAVGYLLLIALWMALFRGPAAVLAAALVVLAAVTLPGLAFVAGWTLLTTELLSAAVFSVLFVGYWFWGNFMPPQKMPTISCSIVQPAGDWAAKGLFDTRRGLAGDCNGFHTLTTAQGWLGIGVLLAGALVAVLAAQIVAGLRAARR